MQNLNVFSNARNRGLLMAALGGMFPGAILDERPQRKSRPARRNRFAHQSPEERDRRLASAQAKRDRKRARVNGTGMCAA